MVGIMVVDGASSAVATAAITAIPALRFGTNFGSARRRPFQVQQQDKIVNRVLNLSASRISTSESVQRQLELRQRRVKIESELRQDPEHGWRRSSRSRSGCTRIRAAPTVVVAVATAPEAVEMVHCSSSSRLFFTVAGSPSSPSPSTSSVYSSASFTISAPSSSSCLLRSTSNNRRRRRAVQCRSALRRPTTSGQLERGGGGEEFRFSGFVARTGPGPGSGPPAATAPVSEQNRESIDPGLLSRVSKLYRPAVVLPGLGNNTSDYDVLVQSLEALEIPTTVVKVARIDWLRNAAGLLDGDYWRGKLRPTPVLNWYLDRVKTAIEAAQHANRGGDSDGKVTLIGHSAGGWLARVYMAEFGTQDVALLVTLGTPHLPPPRGVPGVFDQTRGLLYHIEENYPGAYHAPDVKYVCVAGRFLKGGGRAAEEQKTPVLATGAGTLNLEAATVPDDDKEIEEGIGEEIGGEVGGEVGGEIGEETGDRFGRSAAIDATEGIAAADKEDSEDQGEKLVQKTEWTAEGQPQTVTKKTRPTFRERIVGAGYKQVCGRAEVWGDGVVPEESAYLEGAVNISLDGVYHSPVGASDRERPWYGSAGKIDQWVHHLLHD